MKKKNYNLLSLYSVFFANRHVLDREIVYEGKKEQPFFFLFDGINLAILNGLLHLFSSYPIFGNDQFIKLNFEQGKQKCQLQLPFFILQGYYCCSSLAQGLVITQKALLLALVMQLTWQLYLRA